VASKPAIVTENTKPLAEKPATPMPKASGFAVQLAAPSVEADANTLRDKAKAAGFTAFVQRVETEGGVRYRVRVGPVADRSAAESLRDSVNQKLGASGIVVPNP
jgi:cell division septation protein DedD